MSFLGSGMPAPQWCTMSRFHLRCWGEQLSSGRGEGVSQLLCPHTVHPFQPVCNAAHTLCANLPCAQDHTCAGPAP